MLALFVTKAWLDTTKIFGYHWREGLGLQSRHAKQELLACTFLCQDGREAVILWGCSPLVN